MTERRDAWYCIHRGFAGWCAKGVDVSSSGGTLEHYLPDAVEGCLIYDAEHLFGQQPGMKEFIKLVMSGPMLNPRLAPDEHKPFVDRKGLESMEPYLQGEFKAIAQAANDPEYGGLDDVGLNVYEKLVRDVPGIRIGHVRSGVVEWE